MTNPKPTEDELTRLRILAAYELYQVLRNHQVEDVGRTCIELAERAVEAFAGWLPGDEAKEASTKGEIEWVLQGDGNCKADTQYGSFLLERHCSREGGYHVRREGAHVGANFLCDTFDKAVKFANGWIKREYGKG